jgi:hypothetical protein
VWENNILIPSIHCLHLIFIRGKHSGHGKIDETRANLDFGETNKLLAMFSQQRPQQKQATVAFATPAVATQVFMGPMKQNMWFASNQIH